MSTPEDQNQLVVNYLTLRALLGGFGLALPVTLLAYSALSAGPLRPSISAYYYTPMGDIFVGILCAVGVFFLAYKGYEGKPGEWITDRKVALVGAFGAFVTALVPTPSAPVQCDPCSITGLTASPLHYAGAALFLSATAGFCLLLFIKTDQPEPDAGKRRANLIYRSCGVIILACLAALAVIVFVLPDDSALAATLRSLSAVFWLETIALFAFSTAWLTKGETLRRLKAML